MLVRVEQPLKEVEKPPMNARDSMMEAIKGGVKLKPENAATKERRSTVVEPPSQNPLNDLHRNLMRRRHSLTGSEKPPELEEEAAAAGSGSITGLQQYLEEREAADDDDDDDDWDD
ncbi:hypothetical protein CYMTET_4309 [Cymbomonas tetramitiformis]|uniref:WH2 domain-containing protein n=1 Tax=Cymbomonas tetramitiformis TaxID=36881 RepID=A0AAE0H1P6_9CHLO|nr:hypothetical protein CYMTET_4309 [Cymbomonas tetramitiformis]